MTTQSFRLVNEQVKHNAIASTITNAYTVLKPLNIQRFFFICRPIPSNKILLHPAQSVGQNVGHLPYPIFSPTNAYQCQSARCEDTGKSLPSA